MIRVRHQFPFPPEAVWDIVTDPRRDPEWVDTTPEVKHIAGKIGQAGSMYHFQQHVRGKTCEGSIQITKRGEWDMEFRVEDPFRVSTITYVLAPTKKGCRLTQVSSPRWKVKVPAGFIVKFMVKKQLKKQMRGLESLCKA